MVHIHGDIVINRPPEEVFDVVADTSREPRYNPRMHHAEQVTNGPMSAPCRRPERRHALPGGDISGGERARCLYGTPNWTRTRP